MPFAPMDARVEYLGDLCQIVPMTKRAEEWLRHNIDQPLRYCGKGYVIETKYVDEVIAAMLKAGLKLPTVYREGDDDGTNEIDKDR